jgi:hypothetical protein
MGNNFGNHALVGCPIGIFSLGETDWTSILSYPIQKVRY